MDLIKSFRRSIDLIIDRMLEVNKYLIKSDEQDIADFLRNESDRILFQNKVDSMRKDNVKKDTLKINNRTITISI